MILDFDYIYKKYDLNISGVIHIGGHYGNVISEYKTYSINDIVLFEPLSENFSILTKNIENYEGNIIAHQVALGNENKKVLMNVSDNEGQSSSILTPKVHLTAHPEVSFIGTEEVEMHRLDDYNCKNYNMMVIDVQGYELEVFKGGIETLKNIDYIFCEVNRDEVYEGNAQIEEIDKFLSKYGFERVEVEWYYSQVFGDAFYMKKQIEKKEYGEVSIICACKNRYNALKLSLNSWLMFNEIKEIIIVDWSSDPAIYDLLSLDNRIKIVRVNHKKHFNLSQPLNLASSFVTGKYILKMDCDYIINPYYNFFKSYKIDETSFVSGNPAYQSPEFQNENGDSLIDYFGMSTEKIVEYVNTYSHYFKYLKGLLFVSTENFLKVGGFNEDIQSYGWEDGEIIKRLENINLKHKKINYDYSLIHIPHSDRKRFENSKDYKIEDENYFKQNMIHNYSESELSHQVDYALINYYTEKNKEYLIQNNQLISDSSSDYGYSINPDVNMIQKTKWKITEIENNYYQAMEEISLIGDLDISKMEYFPSVYYITLEESVDRQKTIEEEFSKYQITPIPIKSKRYSECDDYVTGKYLYQLNDGTKGCCVSHLKAIQQWYNTNDEDYAFFCEDDLSLETIQYWNFNWKEFIESIPEDADCVQLFTIRDDYDTYQIRDRYWNDWGATAYIINRDYAKKIIDTYIKGNTYCLQVPNSDVMPLIENMLFTIGKTYTVPLFVENVSFKSTFENQDDDVNEGHKTNHRKARDLVLNYWMSLSEEKVVEKSDIEQLLTNYALDTENPEHNFNLGLWYESGGHTAPALSFYLRCAERSEDEDLAYEALIRGSFCYERQGERDGSARGMLFQAQAFRSDRPEAYFLLSRYAERRQWWQDCYINADLALRYCNFDLPPLRTDVEYPGKYGLLYEKSVGCWWWGKGKETRKLLQEIKNGNYEIRPEHFNIIQNTLSQLATGEIPESELKYNKSSGQKLRFEFEGSEKVEKNYSQSFQDLFVLATLNGKRNGLYLEIGAQQPFYQNNTALLETEFGWDGISIEIKEDLCKMFSEQRKNKILCEDATKINYSDLLNQFGKGTVFDYLQLDCEPSETTYQILLNIPFEQYKFALITYEHDHYVDLTNSYREKSRDYLRKMGYEMLVSNVSPNEMSPFEDWWYHPDLIDAIMAEKMRNIADITDVRSYMIVK